MDVLVLPTIGTTFTVPEVLADPIATNTKLGHYTHFGNLLDLCAIAVPAGTTATAARPALMVLGPALRDDTVLAVAARICVDQHVTSNRPRRLTPRLTSTRSIFDDRRLTSHPVPVAVDRPYRARSHCRPGRSR